MSLVATLERAVLGQKRYRLGRLSARLDSRPSESRHFRRQREENQAMKVEGSPIRRRLALKSARGRTVGMTAAMIETMQSVQHIAVAYDGSPLSEMALHSAIRRTLGSPIAQVHVVCVAQRIRPGQVVRMPSGQKLPHWLALKSLEHIVKRSARDAHGSGRLPRIFVHLRTGDPARVIVDLAYRFHTELICLGTGSFVNKGGVGSVAARVLELSDIPVELQTPLGNADKGQPFNPLRFAYVFGGPELRQDNLGKRGGAGAASA